MVRRLRRFGVAAAVSLCAAGSGALPPASALTAGGGAVAGNVTVTPTIPAALQPCIATNYVLAGVTAHVTTASNAIPSYEGLVFLAGNGGSMCESLLGASGALNLWCTGNFAIIPPGAVVECNLVGVFIRQGNAVHAELQGRFCVNGLCADVRLLIDTTLTPTAPTAFGTAPVHATFTGAGAIV